MASVVRKAVFPAAGLGTRFLPATKAQPKEMLPLVARVDHDHGRLDVLVNSIAGEDPMMLVETDARKAHGPNGRNDGSPALGRGLFKTSFIRGVFSVANRYASSSDDPAPHTHSL